MAAIDFPASPSVGQAFTAGNGVTYTWNGLLWVASGASAGGDFCAAQTSAFPVVPTGSTTLVLTQVITGNSGGWYSISTGRYTPPAGRYAISAGYSASNTAASLFYLFLRKNGVNVISNYDVAAAAGQQANPVIDVMLDANGTDWFDIQSAAGSAGTITFTNITFTAFPISGIKGPPGDIGTLSANIGTRIRATFGAGGLSFPTWSQAGWTTVSNDTGVAAAGNFWTPPAGRWVFSCNIQMAAPAGQYVGAGIGTAGAAVTASQTLGTSAGGTGGHVSISLQDVLDFNGSTAMTWMVIASGGSSVVTAESWWTAYRIR